MRVSNIPFNLSFINGNGDEVIVHSPADLLTNFNLSDLWKHFLSGNLARWLKSIDEPQLAEKGPSLSCLCPGEGTGKTDLHHPGGLRGHGGPLLHRLRHPHLLAEGGLAELPALRHDGGREGPGGLAFG